MSEITKIFTFKNTVSSFLLYPTDFSDISNIYFKEYLDRKTLNPEQFLKLIKTHQNKLESIKNISCNKDNYCVVKFTRKSNKNILMSKLLKDIEDVEEEENDLINDNLKSSIRKADYNYNTKDFKSNINFDCENINLQVIYNLNEENTKSNEDYYNNLFKNYNITEVNEFLLDDVSIIKLPKTFVGIEDYDSKAKISKINNNRLFNLISKIKKYSEPILIETLNSNSISNNENEKYDILQFLLVIGKNVNCICSCINEFYIRIEESNEKFKEKTKISIKTRDALYSESDDCGFSSTNNNIENNNYKNIMKRPLNNVAKHIQTNTKDYSNETSYTESKPEKINYNMNTNYNNNNITEGNKISLENTSLINILKKLNTTEPISKEDSNINYTSKKEDLILINTYVAKDIYERIKLKLDYYKKAHKLRFIIKPTKENQLNIQVKVPQNLQADILETIDIQIKHVTVDCHKIPDTKLNSFPNLNYFLSKCVFESVNKYYISDNLISLTIIGNSYNINKFMLIVDAHLFKLEEKETNRMPIESMLKRIEFN